MHILIIGVPEGEEREKGTEKILEEIIAENFPNFPMGKEIINQVWEAQRNLLCRINPSHRIIMGLSVELV